MKVERKQTGPKQALILFPTGRIGQKIVRIFAEHGYQVGVVVLGDGKQASQVAPTGDNVRIVNVALPDESFWRGLPADLAELLLKAPSVVYHAATDFLRLKSSGKDDEWRLDADDQAQRRFGFVEELISRRAEHPPALWVNLVVGVTGVQAKKGTYCRTRYGLLGFTQILRLNRAFRDTEIRNICLSYFKDFRKGHSLEQCANCTTRELRDTLVTWNNEDDLVRYLLQESEAVLTRWPTRIP